MFFPEKICRIISRNVRCLLNQGKSKFWAISRIAMFVLFISFKSLAANVEYSLQSTVQVLRKNNYVIIGFYISKLSQIYNWPCWDVEHFSFLAFPITNYGLGTAEVSNKRIIKRFWRKEKLVSQINWRRDKNTRWDLQYFDCWSKHGQTEELDQPCWIIIYIINEWMNIPSHSASNLINLIKNQLGHPKPPHYLGPRGFDTAR